MRLAVADLSHLHVGAAHHVDEHAGGAVDADVVEQRTGDGELGGEAGAAVALGAAGAHERAAHVVHHGAHVGEVDVHHAALGDEITDPLDGLVEYLVRLAERLDERQVVVVERQQLLVGDGHQRVDVVGEELETGLGATGALLALEEERLGRDTDDEDVLLPRELRDDRRRDRA